MMETKICIKCKEEQPPSEFRRRSEGQSLYNNTCRSCERLYQRMHSKDPEIKKRKAERQIRSYYHSQGKTLPETYEYKHNNKPRKLFVTSQERKEYLKDYLTEYWKEYQKRPEFKKRRKEYQQTEEYKESHCSGQKKYHKTENGRIVKKNQRHKRRTLTKDDEGITKLQWNKILKNQNGCCNLCKIKFNQQLPPEQDHIIPVTKGGTHTFENIQALCRPCNNSKKAKIVLGFIQAWC